MQELEQLNCVQTLRPLVHGTETLFKQFHKMTEKIRLPLTRPLWSNEIELIIGCLYFDLPHLENLCDFLADQNSTHFIDQCLHKLKAEQKKITETCHQYLQACSERQLLDITSQHLFKIQMTQAKCSATTRWLQKKILFNLDSIATTRAELAASGTELGAIELSRYDANDRMLVYDCLQELNSQYRELNTIYEIITDQYELFISLQDSERLQQLKPMGQLPKSNAPVRTCIIKPPEKNPYLTDQQLEKIEAEIIEKIALTDKKIAENKILAGLNNPTTAIDITERAIELLSKILMKGNEQRVFATERASYCEYIRTELKLPISCENMLHNLRSHLLEIKDIKKTYTKAHRNWLSKMLLWTYHILLSGNKVGVMIPVVYRQSSEAYQKAIHNHFSYHGKAWRQLLWQTQDPYIAKEMAKLERKILGQAFDPELPSPARALSP